MDDLQHIIPAPDRIIGVLLLAILALMTLVVCVETGRAYLRARREARARAYDPHSEPWGSL